MSLWEFLLARIAEDEASIPFGPPAPWVYATHPAYEGDENWSMSKHHVRYRREDYECRVADVWHEDVARFIAQYDPARVLAECEAKRRIVDRITDDGCEHPTWVSDDGKIKRYVGGWCNDCHEVLLDLASVYADHPDFNEEAWR